MKELQDPAFHAREIPLDDAGQDEDKDYLHKGMGVENTDDHILHGRECKGNEVRRDDDNACEGCEQAEREDDDHRQVPLDIGFIAL